MSFKNLLVVKNISLHYNVPKAKSSFCQLIDSFEAKYINGVSFVDPFYSLHWAKLKTYCLKRFVCVCRYKGRKNCAEYRTSFFQQPGDLNYAELDDFRASLQPAAAAAAAEAAPARPLIRRPAYEGTEYADITQFGVPQPEPTYGNIPKKDVVYSNVQGI